MKIALALPPEGNITSGDFRARTRPFRNNKKRVVKREDKMTPVNAGIYRGKKRPGHKWGRSFYQSLGKR
jgi:hypothetical protein